MVTINISIPFRVNLEIPLLALIFQQAIKYITLYSQHPTAEIIFYLQANGACIKIELPHWIHPRLASFLLFH